jgi:quinol monooxygenase YgiN
VTTVVTTRFKGDPAQLDKVIQADPPRLLRILDTARRYGVLAHQFAAGDGEFLVIDEWPSREAFEDFFSRQPEIRDLMTAAGVEGEPVVSFYEQMDTPDRLYGGTEGPGGSKLPGRM